MRSSCLRHPANESILLVRKWQVLACDGNRCAAALLSFFEYWHNIKLDMCKKARMSNQVAEMHGETGHQDTSLVQFHTIEDLCEKILGFYKDDKIRESIRLLIDKGFIKQFKNPNPRYKFDNTWHFLFLPSRVQEFIDSTALPNADLSDNDADYSDDRCPENRQSYPKNPGRSSESPGWAGENRGAIPETTTEISLEVEEVVLPRNWSPSEKIVSDLKMLHGFSLEWIDQQVPTFVGYWNQRGESLRTSPDALFFDHCIARSKIRRLAP